MECTDLTPGIEDLRASAYLLGVTKGFSCIACIPLIYFNKTHFEVIVIIEVVTGV